MTLDAMRNKQKKREIRKDIIYYGEHTVIILAGRKYNRRY
jgi:hypothetical protein